MGLAFQVAGVLIALINLFGLIFYAGRLVERIEALRADFQSMDQRVLTLERELARGGAGARAR